MSNWQAHTISCQLSHNTWQSSVERIQSVVKVWPGCLCLTENIYSEDKELSQMGLSQIESQLCGHKLVACQSQLTHISEPEKDNLQKQSYCLESIIFAYTCIPSRFQNVHDDEKAKRIINKRKYTCLISQTQEKLVELIEYRLTVVFNGVGAGCMGIHF